MNSGERSSRRGEIAALDDSREEFRGPSNPNRRQIDAAASSAASLATEWRFRRRSWGNLWDFETTS